MAIPPGPSAGGRRERGPDPLPGPGAGYTAVLPPRVARASSVAEVPGVSGVLLGARRAAADVTVLAFSFCLRRTGSPGVSAARGTGLLPRGGTILFQFQEPARGRERVRVCARE